MFLRYWTHLAQMTRAKTAGNVPVSLQDIPPPVAAWTELGLGTAPEQGDVWEQDGPCRAVGPAEAQLCRSSTLVSSSVPYLLPTHLAATPQ